MLILGHVKVCSMFIYTVLSHTEPYMTAHDADALLHRQQPLHEGTSVTLHKLDDLVKSQYRNVIR